VKLSEIDLNLFVVFDAIYTEGNLTRAGEIIGITQPAVSNSLSRLRNLLGDPLFMRTADGMVPTPVAQNIIGSVRQSLSLIRSSVQDSERFKPEESDKRFRVSMHDLNQAVTLPVLVKRIKDEAPNVSIDCYQVRRRDMNIELAAGNLDFAVDIALTPDPHVLQAHLFTDHQVCMIRRDHPAIENPLRLETYLELPHIQVSSRRGGLGHVDLALGKMGKRRNIVLRTQHHLVAPALVANTNLVMTATSQFARLVGETCDVTYFELPFDAPPLETFLYWHESTDKDQANCWMREHLTSMHQESAG